MQNRRAGIVTVMAALAVCVVQGTALGVPGSAARERVVFHIQSASIVESSSLVLSSTHRGVVYTANDSGDRPVVYVLDDRGALVGRTTLANTAVYDVEAMAAGADGSLVLADIGDNSGNRADIAAYRFPQPGRGDHYVTPSTVRLRYPDGPTDAESAIYDSRTGRLYVVTKQFRGAGVYVSPTHVFDRGSVRLRRIASAVPVATDATWVPGAHRVIVRTYWDATIYRFPGWKPIDSFDLPEQKQGESIATLPGGRTVWIGSEGVHSAVLSVALPRPPTPAKRRPAAAPSATPPPGDTDARADGQRDEQVAKLVLVSGGAALLASLVVLGGLARRHRRRS
jgi:hypothetical protein